MDKKSKAQKFYEETKKFKNQRINWYVDNEEEHHGNIFWKFVYILSKKNAANLINLDLLTITKLIGEKRSLVKLFCSLYYFYFYCLRVGKQ